MKYIISIIQTTPLADFNFLLTLKKTFYKTIIVLQKQKN